MVLANFTDFVIKHKGLLFNLATSLTEFLVKNVEQIFTVPTTFREKVEMRIKEEKQGVVPIVKGKEIILDFTFGLLRNVEKLTEKTKNGSYRRIEKI